MENVETKEIVIHIPGMTWTTWLDMVNVALEESNGVLDYETTLATQQSKVKFAPGLIDEQRIMENITKRTGYTNLSIKS